jgi:hypothetical protein
MERTPESVTDAADGSESVHRDATAGDVWMSSIG